MRSSIHSILLKIAIVISLLVAVNLRTGVAAAIQGGDPVVLSQTESADVPDWDGQLTISYPDGWAVRAQGPGFDVVNAPMLVANFDSEKLLAGQIYAGVLYLHDKLLTTEPLKSQVGANPSATDVLKVVFDSTKASMPVRESNPPVENYTVNDKQGVGLTYTCRTCEGYKYFLVVFKADHGYVVGSWALKSQEVDANLPTMLVLTASLTFTPNGATVSDTGPKRNVLAPDPASGAPTDGVSVYYDCDKTNTTPKSITSNDQVYAWYEYAVAAKRVQAWTDAVEIVLTVDNQPVQSNWKDYIKTYKRDVDGPPILALFVPLGKLPVGSHQIAYEVTFTKEFFDGFMTIAKGEIVSGACSFQVNAVAYSKPVVLPPPAPSGKIVVSSNHEGKFQLYVMNADGSNRQRITTQMAAYWPAWSPDAKKIAFSGGPDGQRDLYVMNADGSGVQRLTSNRADSGFAEWTSDGKQILFSASGNIYLMNSNGSGKRQLTFNMTGAYFPKFSPDEQHIVFLSGEDVYRDVFIMRRDGTGLRNLTHNRADDVDASYSPDGNTIVFASNRSGNYELYTMSPSGGNVAQLTSSTGDNLHASWSPDGSSIVYMYNPTAPWSRSGSFNSKTFFNGQWELYRMRVDGSEQLAVTDTLGDADAPDWSK